MHLRRYFNSRIFMRYDELKHNGAQNISIHISSRDTISRESSNIKRDSISIHISSRDTIANTHKFLIILCNISCRYTAIFLMWHQQQSSVCGCRVLDQVRIHVHILSAFDPHPHFIPPLQSIPHLQAHLRLHMTPSYTQGLFYM